MQATTVNVSTSSCPLLMQEHPQSLPEWDRGTPAMASSALGPG